MNRLYPVPDDFEAVIRIFTSEEGGRLTPTFNGIRWDFCYADDRPEERLWAIYPDFFDSSGNTIPRDVPLPMAIESCTRMSVLNDEIRKTVHRERIQVGTQFFCHEGARRVAIGRVTKITGLFDERDL
jgi:translation elongation factor EF-Tu-like GTPase